MDGERRVLGGFWVDGRSRGIGSDRGRGIGRGRGGGKRGERVEKIGATVREENG